MRRKDVWRRLCRGLLVGALAAGPGLARAQAQAARLTLRQALDYARAHQPSLRAAQARVEAAREEAASVRAGWLPRAGVTAQLFEGTTNNSTAQSLNAPAVDLPRIGGTAANAAASWSPAASSLVGIGLRQELFDFGRIASAAAAQELLAQAADEQLSAQRLDLDFAVVEAFGALQSAKSIEHAADAAYQRAKAHRELAAAGVRAGLRTPNEQTRAEADLARFEVGRIRASGGVSSARMLLAAVIGSPDPAVDVTDEQWPQGPVPPLEAILGSLGHSDPLVREAQARLRAQQEDSQALSARLRPELSLTAGLNGRAGGAPVAGREGPVGDGWLPAIPNWDVGLVVSWPFLDPVAATHASASRKQERVREAELEAVSQQARALIQRRYLELEIARASVPALERALDAARANQAQAEARFKAGLGTSVELADAEALLTDAEIQLVVGRYEQSRARAVLGRAISEAVP